METESNGNGHEPVILGAMVEFLTMSGQKLRMQPLDALVTLQELGEAARKEGKDQVAYLRSVVETVNEVYGVQISLGEAEALIDEVQIAHLNAKKKRNETLQMLRSPQSSTD